MSCHCLVESSSLHIAGEEEEEEKISNSSTRISLSTEFGFLLPSMSPKVPPASLHALDTCTFQLHNWRPFQIHTRTLNSDHTNGFLYKRPCRADRATSFPFDAIDFSKLSLFDDHRPLSVHKRGGLRWRARKRRRIRGSRSGSGRSSDRSGTTRRCCSVGASAANGTCSDFLVTDSSGELFVNGDANWASDVSEAIRNLRREREHGSADKENLSFALQNGNFDSQGFESGYGSEPGYRGDAELGYGNEFDEEEDDQRILFWCHEFGVSKREKVGENTLQKGHHRWRRRKHDLKMVDLMRYGLLSSTRGV
ncbi:uncharacterized protein LOC116024576 isoform X2 [Ipomoea triloba]|uniref:uncharacterized protein LOC116024576 isoform X2 n=1 Tax=Ipomoea triloba TaxID=35885 RepID=UPI00125D386F|nr:uncharacterized protein LOC116024576 isoform X2 [Ipomoea triloba]